MISFQYEYNLLKKKGTIGFLLLVIASYSDVAFAVSTTLSVSAASAIEHRPFNMTCKTDTSKSFWLRNNLMNTYIVIGLSPTNQTCISQGINMSIFEYFCERNAINENMFTFTFKNVTRKQQNDEWRCGNAVNNGFSNTITINVSVPVDHVKIGSNEMSTITLNETGSKSLNCTTSPSRPRANISWYVITTDLCDSNTIQINDHATYTRSDDDLQTTTSTIELTLNRTYNGCILVCKAENIRYEAVYHDVSLNITYPTNKPVIQCTHNNTYKVIGNYVTALTCTVDGGNPDGSLQWNCTGYVAEQRGTRSNGIVSKTITWIATQKTFCTCNSINIAGTSTASVTTSILYPPVMKQTEQKTLIEGDSTILQCGVVHANPPVNLIRWSYGRHNVTNTTLAISNISRSDVNVYTCTAINTMDPSCQDVVYGSTSRSIQIEVLYKPRADMDADLQFYVTSAINQTVTLSYTALAYPHPSFEWYRNGSSLATRASRFNISSTELQTNLTIPNVEERDIGEYTLIVSNDVGSINESFQLKPDGLPEVPTDLTQDESSSTFSSIALYWKSGFNNGSKQNFTVMYRKQTEETWQSVTVQDAGHTGTEIHYNINGLSSNTSYDIVLFAVNAKGRSKTNVTLTCSTNREDTGHADIIGASIGSTAVFLFIGVVIACVVIYRRRMTKKPSEEPEASASLYVNVKRDNESVIKYELKTLVIPTDRGIYENTELGKTKNQRHKPHDENLSQTGEYVNFSKEELAEMRMPKQEELSMQMISSNIKATTERQTASDAPLSFLSKTEFAGGLCNVDDDEDHEGSIAHHNDENMYSNSSEMIEQIEIHELYAFVTGNSFESLATEFHVLPKGLTMPCTVAAKPENIKLNRYNGILPYDHSRVTMSDDPDFFINACYMDKKSPIYLLYSLPWYNPKIWGEDKNKPLVMTQGYMKEKCYIASSGPTADTSSGFKNFWKMVWYEWSDIIMMVTNLREITGMKCEQYWPKFGTSKVYGEVTVTCRNVEEYAEYTIRTFSVSNATLNRNVTQLHFTAWPDKGVPDDLTSLLEFRQRLKSTPSPEPGPIIVHCSTGIGRTGTLIALDRLIAAGKATHSINVSTCVRSMRQQRVNMVQTPEQYVYIHKACVYALAFECECISAETFHDKLKATTDAQFDELFKDWKTVVDNDSDDEKKAILNNKQDKSNRPTADIAGDRYRVRLYVDKRSGDSDYINAVYISSFKTKDRFIAAQTPKKEFVQDFICMIFQEQCVCVIDMDGNTPSQLDVGAYIPIGNQSFTFGNFTISSDKLYSNKKLTVNKMKIENIGKCCKGEWTSYHFKYHNWKHGKDTPTGPSDFVEFVKEVDDYATQFGEYKSHVLIHCLDASKRSGLFCFVACLLEKIQCEREVNVGNTLRQVRTRRKTTIKNANNLKFCYKTVDAFVEMNKAM